MHITSLRTGKWKRRTSAVTRYWYNYTYLRCSFIMSSTYCVSLLRSLSVRRLVMFTFSYKVVPGEPVEIVDGEFQSFALQLVVRYLKGKSLIENRVTIFPMNFGLVLPLPVRAQINLHVGV